MSMPATDAQTLRSLFVGPNAGYILDLYDQYRNDPAAADLDPALKALFDAADPADLEMLGAPPPKRAAANGRTTGPVPTPVVSNGTTASAAPAPASTAPTATNVAQIVGVAQLASAIRDLGHLDVQLDPLGTPPPGSPELDAAQYGLTDADLAAIPAVAVGGPVAEGLATAGDAIARLRRRYSNRIGFDLDHIQVPAERAWLRDAIEGDGYAATLPDDRKRAVLERLTQVEAFETFLHQTYPGQKRFSVEGTDILIPVLDEIIQEAAGGGTREVVVGMAHRGRLNVLTHVLGKPYEAIIAAFEGGKGKQPTAVDTLEAEDEVTGNDHTDDVTGDVKYHLGAKLSVDSETGAVTNIPLVLAPNPSHLEAVNPIVVGMTRASQDQRDHPGEPTRDDAGSMAILLHGDAAFPGQGIVAETLNLSGLPGYTVGGTIHIIVNNQIGYTTDTGDSRSSLYASDLAKGFEIPIFHVSADDPEACLAAARIALAFRQKFHKDVLIDLVGYRRWGHNEGDDPTFTQPLMYQRVQKLPTVRARWAAELAERGVVSAADAEAMRKARLAELGDLRKSVTEGTANQPPEEHPSDSPRREVETALSEERLRAYHAALHTWPDDFKPLSKLNRQLDKRRALIDSEDGKLDWANGEALAFAGIIADGIPVRLSGQDAERGTFVQRHLVLHESTSGETYNPLANLPDARATFAVYNSPLSENACVGFEYGYSVHAPEALVLWEGQFGDFVNGAQVVIDQFLASARAKWQQEPALVLLLPHGYEGQGPEHSSGRLERFLQLVARDNLRVANCTTSAQYFHLLRRQAALLHIDRRPLVIMTPKSLLRHPLAASPVADFTSGTFRPVLDDDQAADRRAAVTRLVLCSGRVWVDLEASDRRAGADHVAVVRVEQLAPFQRTAISDVLGGYPNLEEIVWVQEEPRNMGAWTFMESRLRELVGESVPVRYVGRPNRASPAEGSADMHAIEQSRIVAAAFDLPSRTRRQASAGADGGATADAGADAGATGNGASGGATANGAHRGAGRREPATVGED
ncbi:MAG TPA: 2-oxoglutarate dehydrogenase E1 component [Thermomicrobiales bacterium]|jgi:2-oxoglutarate dehydrogenase E1 component|nr:2-oxoglutarate dehydrogenase E1 component [Thermomicrobiales bacterium]